MRYNYSYAHNLFYIPPLTLRRLPRSLIDRCRYSSPPSSPTLLRHPPRTLRRPRLQVTPHPPRPTTTLPGAHKHPPTTNTLQPSSTVRAVGIVSCGSHRNWLISLLFSENGDGTFFIYYKWFIPVAPSPGIENPGSIFSAAFEIPLLRITKNSHPPSEPIFLPPISGGTG